MCLCRMPFCPRFERGTYFQAYSQVAALQRSQVRIPITADLLYTFIFHDAFWQQFMDSHWFSSQGRRLLQKKPIGLHSQEDQQFRNTTHIIPLATVVIPGPDKHQSYRHVPRTELYSAQGGSHLELVGALICYERYWYRIKDFNIQGTLHFELFSSSPRSMNGSGPTQPFQWLQWWHETD
jgi:hypothetical protein